MSDIGLGSWPTRRARITPHRVALRDDDRSLTYAELAAEVDRLAGGLARLGVRPGDRVAYLGPNAVTTFEALFATCRLGAVFVPLNTRLATPELARLLADCRPAVLVRASGGAQAEPGFGGAEHPQRDPGGAQAEPGFGGAEHPQRDPGGAPPDRAATTLTVEEFAALTGEPGVPAEVDLDRPAVILYTSGTTGQPKGAVLTHGNLTFNTINQLAHVDVLSTDVVLCTAPLFHAAGLGQVSLPTLFKGGTVVVAPRFDPGWLLHTIAKRQIRAFAAVPTMLQALCEHPDWPAADLTPLRYVIYGGSPVVEWVARAWQARGVPILQGYGMTEASPGVLLATVDGATDRPTSPGVPHFFTDVRLGPLDELLVQGPNVSPGYWQRPAETGDAFQDGWFRSGDIARARDDGWIDIVDRVKDMYISGGENVYPAEVEAALAELPGVAGCAVIGVPDPRWGETGFALVVPRPDAALDEATVLAHLAARIARYKLPGHVRLVPDLPRTASGKVRKSELRALLSKEDT